MLGEEPRGPSCDASTTCVREQPVADLALAELPVHLVDGDAAEDLVRLCVDDEQRHEDALLHPLGHERAQTVEQSPRRAAACSPARRCRRRRTPARSWRRRRSVGSRKSRPSRRMPSAGNSSGFAGTSNTGEILVPAAREADEDQLGVELGGPCQSVRRLERRDDPLRLGEAVERGERLRVGRRTVLGPAGVPQERVLRPDAGVVEPRGDRVGVQRSGRLRPRAATSGRRGGRRAARPRATPPPRPPRRAARPRGRRGSRRRARSRSSRRRRRRRRLPATGPRPRASAPGPRARSRPAARGRSPDRDAGRHRSRSGSGWSPRS